MSEQEYKYPQCRITAELDAEWQQKADAFCGGNKSLMIQRAVAAYQGEGKVAQTFAKLAARIDALENNPSANGPREKGVDKTVESF